MEDDKMSRSHYEWYFRCQVECLTPIRISSGTEEHIKKLLIIPVIEEKPEKGQSEGVEDDE